VLLAERASADAAMAAAEQLIAAVRPLISLDDRELVLTASAGVGIFPDDAESVPGLIASAEAAMYEAKRMGRNMARRYTTSTQATPSERLALQRDLQHAIERDELELYYQPMYDVASREITGVEALLRWRHPQHGLLLPDRFIPIAEECGAIDEIGDWVMGRACEQIRDWKDAGIPKVRVSVNVSARQFEKGDLLDRIYAHVQRWMIPPSSLEIEVTESSIMRDVPTAIRALCDLKEIGLRVSIDDFGTGYTSLRFLKRFPVDVLKIDRSFIRDVATGVFDGAIVRAVTTLARSLGVVTIAEGVEVQAQFDRLRDLDCDEVQGFLFSRPMTAAACTPLLLAGTSLTA
jgi:EAL domain-containing protein (putative c-di-GMP-specific phosphodiesterase class I)